MGPRKVVPYGRMIINTCIRNIRLKKITIWQESSMNAETSLMRNRIVTQSQISLHKLLFNYKGKNSNFI